MAKTKERSELEFLRSENKSLRSEIRQLKKAVGRHEKRQHLFEKSELEDKEEIEVLPAKKTASCPKCRSELELIPLGTARTIQRCTSCKYRTSVKNG